MATKLEEICGVKYEHIAKRKKEVPLAELEARVKETSAPRGFEKSLRAKEVDGKFGIIAELKKASPSKGVLRMNYNPAEIAKGYEAGGAACISVLTDEPFFQGADEHLQQAREAVSIPALRKDFILDPYQILESRALGADCVLLIAAALSDEQLWELNSTARAYGMDVLIETHTREEIFRALTTDSYLIGINNRDLATLQVDMNTSKNLSRYIPGSYLRVCESGIKTKKEMIEMRKYWFNSFLIGESLITEPDVKTAIGFLV